MAYGQISTKAKAVALDQLSNINATFTVAETPTTHGLAVIVHISVP